MSPIQLIKSYLLTIAILINNVNACTSSNCTINAFDICNNTQKCTINCTDANNFDCSGYLINALNLSYLTLNCGSNNCQQTIIHCPSSDCSINCIGSEACDSFQVYQIDINSYNTTKSITNINCYGDLACSWSDILINSSNAVEIDCIGKGSCFQMSLTTYSVDSVHMKCENVIDVDNQYSSESPCYATDIMVYNSSTFIFDAIHPYATESIYIYVYDTSQAIINAKGRNAIGLDDESYFVANTTDYVEINIASTIEIQDGSLRNGLLWYLPINSTINCYATGCEDLGYIALFNNDTSGLVTNIYGCDYCYKLSKCIGTRAIQFELRCNQVWPNVFRYGYGACYLPVLPYDTRYYDQHAGPCGCKDFMENRFNYYDGFDNENCYFDPTPEPTPHPVTSKYVYLCTKDTKCDIECKYGDYYGTLSCGRDGSLFNGSLASYLTVLCLQKSICNEVYIICPIAGCSIKCHDYRTCKNAVIIHDHDGKTESEGDVVVDCRGQDSCVGIVIYADYVNSLKLNCKADDGSTCQLELYARYANDISLYFDGSNADGAMVNSYLYLSNATNVEIIAIRALETSLIHTENVESLSVTCITDEVRIRSACNDNAWYLPSNTKFNCFGEGCLNIGSIYKEDGDLSGIDIYINGCSQCQDERDCINDLVFYCGRGYPSRIIYNESGCHQDVKDYWDGFDYALNGDCGCLKFFADITMEDIAWHDQCYDPSMAPATISGIIVGVGFFIVCCISVYCYCKRWEVRRNAMRIKESDDDQAIVENEMAVVNST